jgi:hypothetical protein
MPYAAVTRATLRGQLQARYTGDPFWSDTEANDAINEALRYFNLFTGYWRGTGTTATTINSPFVAVPGTLTYRTRVYVSGRALTRKSIVEFYRGRRTWRTDLTTSGGGVPTTIREWAPVGLSQIATWPTDAVGGTTLSFDGVRLTPVLTADGDFLDLGNEEIGILLDEALWVLAFKRPSILEAMAERHQRFLQACLERNDQLRQSSHFRQALGLDQEQRLVPIRTAMDPVVPGTPSTSALESR